MLSVSSSHTYSRQEDRRRLSIWVSFPGGVSGKEPACQSRRHKRPGFNPWVRKIPWRRAWLPTPVLLPGESHGQRSLAGHSPWGRTESDTTEATSTKSDHETRAQKRQMICLNNYVEITIAWWNSYDPSQSHRIICWKCVELLQAVKKNHIYSYAWAPDLFFYIRLN